MFGTEAGIIIANPNGITCAGCGFINTSKVELVTGTANFSGDDLTGFSIDGSSTLTVSGSGFLSDSVPNTSIAPSKSLPLVPVTCNRIRSASLPAVILELAVTAVLPNVAVPSLALLF